MCGRFALTVSARVLAEVFDADPPADHHPRYNVAPTQPVLTVRKDLSGKPTITPARWGLIPHWAKDAGIGARMINARAETVADKPAFRTAVRRRRCLIPADGFYEWRKEDGGKQPYLVRFSDGRVFTFAGLWESWQPTAGGDPVESCTIITTSPNELLAALHDRMPVILPFERHDEWLDAGELGKDRLRSLLGPIEASGLEARPVSRHVNRPANDDPVCVEPIGPSLEPA